MAKTLEQLQAEFDAISEKTRIAYDKLKSRSGSEFQEYPGGSLDAKYSIAVRNKNTKAINALKPIFDAAQKEYKDAQEKKNALRKELNSAKKAEETGKVSAAKGKSANSLYQKTLDELKSAELSLEGYKGSEKYQDAYRKAQQAYNDAVAAGVNPTPLGEPKIEVPPVKVEGTTDGTTDGTVKEPTISEFIATITAPKNKQLLIDVQKDLAKNFGYTGPVDGSPSTGFLPALQKAYTDRAGLPEAWRGTDFRSFLTNPNVAGFGGSTGGAGGMGGANLPYTTISSESQAKSAINQIFKSELGRDATPAEIKKLYPELIKAQAANPSKQKIVNGVRQTITGLDVGQWITEKAQALPEFKTKKAEKAGGTKEDIIASLNANGLPVDEMQIADWVKQVENGGSLDAIKRGIRQVAAIGQPESIKKMIAEGTDLATVYAPYKLTMSKALEIPIDSIKLDDPTLRQAIGPDKEMSIYDFQKALRQDQRWQYTDQARSEASDVATKVLRDFGFMG